MGAITLKNITFTQTLWKWTVNGKIQHKYILAQTTEKLHTREKLAVEDTKKNCKYNHNMLLNLHNKVTDRTTT